MSGKSVPRAGCATLLACAALSFGHTAEAQESVQGPGGARGARWRSDVIRMTVDETLDDLSDLGFDAVIDAVTAWQVSTPDVPTLVVQHGEPLEIGYNPDGKNQNTVHFAETGEPMANGALAITVITFDADANKILDADIILNGIHRFGTLPPNSHASDVYDLQNVLTHELGHLLGLGEDYDDEDATMYAYSLPGETGKRELSEKDLEAITSLYEGDGQASGCGGAMIAGRPTGTLDWFVGAFLLAGAALVARRRAVRHYAGLAAAGVFMLADWGPAAVPAQSQTLALMPAASVPAVVTDESSHWEGQLIVTDLELRARDCSAEGAACAPLAAKVYGGQVDGVVQVVGHLRPPAIGSEVEVHRGGEAAGSPWVSVNSDDGHSATLTKGGERAKR